MTDAASTVLVGAVEGTTLTAAEREFFRGESLSGITLFRRNIPSSIDDVRLLIDDLQTLRGPTSPKLIIAIDQEGGRVSRLPLPFPNKGPAQGLAKGLWDESACAEIEAYGFDVGKALAGLHINVNFAPVLDILTEPLNTAIGDRVWGTTSVQVELRASAFLAGLQKAGIKGCLKHFPGQGDAKVDTHLGGAVVDTAREVLRQRELAPFRALAHRAPMIMVSHCIYPQLSVKEASRSPEIVGTLLRQDMGYEGVIVSDDMNMGALPQDQKAWQEALVEAVAAGVDMLLVCRHLERCKVALEGLRREAARSKSFAARLMQAAQRVRALRETLQ